MDAASLYQVAVLALATAAVSVTVSKGRIFASARKWISDRSTWLGELVSCFYCTSHWVAIVFTAIYQPMIFSQWIVADFLVSVFVMVAIAALIGGIVTRLIPFQGASQDIGKEVEQLRKALEAARGKLIEQQKLISELQK